MGVLLRDGGRPGQKTKVIAFVRAGTTPSDVPAEVLSEGVAEQHIEIMRGDLARICYEATRDDVAYVFDDSIATLQDIGNRVQVTFERGARGSFDLVIGADGLHSITRRLVFGPEEKFSRFPRRVPRGVHGAQLSAPAGPDARLLVPGRTAAIYPVGDQSQARAVLLWRTPQLHDYDRHDGPAQRQLLHSLYGDLGWELPRLLDELDRSEDLYLDSISQVVMDTWTRGRVALVGDAGYSPGAAVGGGTSLAIIGAYILASELAAAAATMLEVSRPTSGRWGRCSAQPLHRAHCAQGDHPESRQLIWLAAQAMRLLPHIPASLRRRVTPSAAVPQPCWTRRGLPTPTSCRGWASGHAREFVGVRAAQAAPRGVLLGRDTTRYPFLVGLAMHPPGRRGPSMNFRAQPLVS